MNLKSSFRKTAIVASVALTSVAMSGVASAETFPVSAAVQTTVAITGIVGMNLGTLYATNASGASGENYAAITLSPAGTMSAKVGGTAIVNKPLIALGGHAPATATIAVSSTAPVTLTLPSAEISGVVPGGALYGAGISALASKVLISAADPAVAKFQLTGFTVGAVTGGTAQGGTGAGSCVDVVDAAYTCILTPAFGSTALNFAIGATIVTDVSSTNTAYQPTTYTGSFTVTATY